MTPASVFVWRVRLWLLAVAIGLLAVNDHKIIDPGDPVVPALADSPLAHQPLAALSRVHIEDGAAEVPAAAAPLARKPTLSKMAARTVARDVCWGRSASKRQSPQASPAAAKQCKTWSAAAGANSKTAQAGQRQRFSRAATGGKRHSAVASARRPGASPSMSKLAKRSEPRPTIAAEKPRHSGPGTG